MATIDHPFYRLSVGDFAKPVGGQVRYAEVYINIPADYVGQATADVLNLWSVPAGCVILGGGLQNIEASTDTAADWTLRLGTTALSGALQEEATAGTYAVHADVSGGAPMITSAVTAVNILQAGAIRDLGIVRAFFWMCEGTRLTGQPALAIRDAIDGSA